MRDIFHFAADEDCRSKQLVRTLLALSLTNARVRAASEEVHTRMKELAQEVVRGGQSSGELRDDISAERLTAMFVAVYLSSLFIWAELDDFSDSIHTILDRQFALLWRGIRSF